jgi:hypothetical protein
MWRHTTTAGCLYCCGVAGKAKESSARSCHQEVLRQSKTTLAAAAAAAEAAAAAAAAAAAEGNVSCPTGDSAEPEGVTAGEAAAGPGASVRVCDVLDAPAANGYLSAAELVLQLNLPGLGHRLLELAAGDDESAGILTGL